MSIRGLKVTDKEIRYVFPRSLQPIRSFSNVQQLGSILRKHFKDLKLPNFPYRHIAQNKGYVQCQYCPNALIYELGQDKKTYELKQFSIEHIHAKDVDKHQRYNDTWIKKYTDFRVGKKQIQQLLNKFSENINSSEQTIENQPQVYTSFEEMIAGFKANDYYVYYEPQKFSMGQPYPDLLIVITPSMRDMYLRYGRCVGFDFTFNMIREIPLHTRGKKEQYLIGVIAGLNSFRRITIYGLVASTKQQPKTIQTIFSKFFEYTQKHPETIVTDEAIGMLYGIRNLQQKGIFKGQSYWDTFHVLKSYRFHSQELRRAIRHMVREKCPYKFQRMYLQAVNMTISEEEMDSLHKFMHQSQKYCISQIKAVFVGLGVSDTQNQIAHNVIKSELPYEQKYLSVISKLVTFLDQRNLLTSVCVRQTCKIEQVIGQRDFQILRLALPMKVHSFFYTQFYKATMIEIISVENDRTIFFVQDSDSIYRVNFVKHDQFNSLVPNKKLYQCSCNFKEKTGVPCQHILKIVISEKANIIDQIDPYYVIEDPQNMQACTMMHQKIQQKIRKRGRPAERAVFYVERKDMQKLPDKIATVKVRQKRDWGGWATKKMERQKNQGSLMLVSQQPENSDFPEYVKNEKFMKNRSEMMKKFYSSSQNF